jgi:heavy metal efflux system protein
MHYFIFRKVILMLEKIIQFSIKNKLVIGVMTVALIVWGLWSATKLPIDAVPDITNNQVQIITVTPTLATQEVEQFVTYPIEQSVANLPDVEEIRSISRFALSVITIVFKDNVNIYFARQLINEKLKEAEEQIPKGIGTPELAPVSTGLGQIYEYVIHPKKGSENKYSASDLRTMQDWIVARQLYGTPGIAEVNSFGGMLKQYEVAVNPDKLKAMNVTLPEIFTALEKNNQNTGGAYIEKGPDAYFIRGIGLATSLDDIEKIVVKNIGNIPVLIRDVANVDFGHAIRYGAMTRNGEHEVVGGIVMMLKGANSAEVTNRVKAKMEIIKKSLPADVDIEPYLDRTNLVERAISTVERNLTEGALIVILVLVIFLGNFRAGLIVASAIPLSMLFALGLMNVFGVSANLMSLGAIDFGLIVDGAVIIVENVLHKLSHSQKLSGRLTQKQMDETVSGSAKQMMSSAAFGQIIILIVYLPILSLQGIEGKMFRPMAETVGFAILGALILSLTYIPMVSSLFLSKNIKHKVTFADRMMNFFHRLYNPVIHWAVRFNYALVGAAALVTIIAVIIFSRMGGEFIPQLEEGDYAFEFYMPQGTSLSQSKETSMQASKILKSFPEVKEVIAKTGSAEIPTDPMPPEASDIMIILKDKKDWVTTKDYKELAELMEEKLKQIPGVAVEASQPIQMRFNELMTGVKQDVAIKIFGDNLDTLAALGPQLAKIIQTVPGVETPKVERTTGLPQITITYDRNRIAAYGLNIEDVNDVISTAFAGKKAGVVFENERRFDLVVRLDSAHRTSIDDVSNLYIPTSTGIQIPLSQVATVAFKEGPAQISREDAKRRIVIGFNVKDRDVQSVVKDIQQKLKSFILPTGYYLTYGGTFENLQKASARLMIAVPAALLLIFVMLYFTFHSAKEAAIIFTAIPMAAIGGVFALLIRGMPFSISAGIGFIALFGVAVLNGIVLISTFNQLAKDGITDVVQRVYEGTKIRLRPVLMTATVASLGFLPMAISTGAGAEVQKPLATVVIGGLMTATLLTLVVLPLLYIIFTKPKKRGNSSIRKVVSIAVLLFISQNLFVQKANAQTRISLSAAYDTALVNNLQIHASDLQIQRSNTLKNTWWEMPKTGVFVENEDINPQDRQGVLKIGLSQSLEWPGVYKARKNLLEEQAKSVEISKQIKALEIKKNVQETYYNLWYFQSKQLLWKRLDSIYSSLAQAALLKVRTGESAGLDSIAALAKSKEVSVQLSLLQRDILMEQQNLKKLLNTSVNYLPEINTLQKMPVSFLDSSFNNHPLLQLQRQNISISNAEINLQKQSRNPNFEGRFFSQRLYGIKNPYSGFSVSVGIPIFGGSVYRNKIKAAQLESNYQQTLLDYEKISLSTSYNQAYQQLLKDNELVSYYESTGLQQAEAILKSANIAYRAGEISFAELSQFITQAIDIQKNYLDVLNQYNQSAIQLNYYLNR